MGCKQTRVRIFKQISGRVLSFVVCIVSPFVSLLVIARVIVRPLHESTSALCLSNSSC